MSDPRRILITGANGFIGRHCIQPCLDRGFEIIAPYMGEPLPTCDPGVMWVPCDLRRPDEVHDVARNARATHLLHLAWPFDENDLYGGSSNVLGVGMGLEVFRAFADAGGKRAVVAGSCAEYDWEHAILREAETPRHPATFYGLCKHHLRCLLEAFADRAGIALVWGHLFFLYGPHENSRRLIPYAVNALLRGEPAQFTHGNQVRDYLHIEDTAGALIHLLDQDLRGPVNIASGRPVPVKEILSRIGELTGRPELIQLGVKATPEHETARLEADVNRLFIEAGWSPTYALEDGLKQTVDWWRQQTEQAAE